jgi:uncharacterized protein (TIGR02996 family)
MSDKSEAQQTIGTVLDSNAKRDAIHFAVAPVIAGEDLLPGQHVGLWDQKRQIAGSLSEREALLGIVDPFLQDVVNKGERFWLMLYPNTITSLRHEWVHPAFGPTVEVESEPMPSSGTIQNDREAFLAALDAKPNDEALYGIYADWLEERDEIEEAKRIRSTPKSRQMIRQIAEECGETYEWLMEAAQDYQENGTTMCFGTDDGPQMFRVMADKFWLHYHTVTGKHVNNNEDYYFRCAC